MTDPRAPRSRGARGCSVPSRGVAARISPTVMPMSLTTLPRRARRSLGLAALVALVATPAAAQRPATTTSASTVAAPDTAALSGLRTRMLGPYRGGEFSTGIDTPEQFARLPQNYSGGIWTNEIEANAPLAGKRK